MRKILLVIVTLLLCASYASAQVGQATSIISGGTLPTTCNPNGGPLGNLFNLTTAATGKPLGLYLCLRTNTYVALRNLTVDITNATVTGTTLNKAAKLTGAPSTAVITSAGDTTGILGVVVASAGTTGTATIALSGRVAAVFDGATTAGHYAQDSASVAGDFTDAGATYPTSGEVDGIVLSTNGGTGTYDMILFPPEIRAATSTTLTAHTISVPLTCADTSASATTYTCSTSPSITPANQDIVLFTNINQANSGSSTLNVDGVGAKTIKKLQGAANLQAGDLAGGGETLMQYDGTNWQMLSQVANAGATGTVTSITATAPIVVTPTPLVTTGVISCPSCSALPTLAIHGMILGTGFITAGTFALFDEAAQAAYLTGIAPLSPGYARNLCTYVRTANNTIMNLSLVKNNVTQITPTVPLGAFNAVGSYCNSSGPSYVRYDDYDTMAFLDTNVAGGTSPVFNGMMVEYLPDDNYFYLGATNAASNGFTQATGTTSYASFFSGTGGSGTILNATQNNREIVMPFDATVQKFRAVTRTAQPAANTLTLTINDNEANTTSVVTVAASKLAGLFEDSTHHPAIAQGHRVTIEVKEVGANTSAAVNGMMLYLSPDSGGCNAATSTSCKFVIGATINKALTANNNYYCEPFVNDPGTSTQCTTTEANAELGIPFTFTISNCYVQIQAASGGGNTTTLVPMIDGVAAASTIVTINSAATGTITGTGSDTVTGGSGHYLSFRFAANSTGTGPTITSFSCQGQGV